MLQSVSSVFSVYRHKTLTGSPDPMHVKTVRINLAQENNKNNIAFSANILNEIYVQPTEWYVLLVTELMKNDQEVSRCHTKGESEEPIAFRSEIHPGFQAQDRRHKKSKTGVLVAPHKGLMYYKNVKKKRKRNCSLLTFPTWVSNIVIFSTGKNIAQFISTMVLKQLKWQKSYQCKQLFSSSRT